MIFSKAWVINICLMALVVFLGTRGYETWSDGERPLPEAAETTKHSEPEKENVVVGMASPDLSAYQSIVNNNLFSVSRTSDDHNNEEKSPEPESEPAPDPRLLKILEATIRQISIYGVIIDGEEKKVLLEGPLSPVSGDSPGSNLHDRMKNRRSLPGRETKWVKVGELVNRFKVKEITPVGLTLGAEGLDFDVILYDETKPKKREPEKKSAGTVVIDTSKKADAVSPAEKAETPVVHVKESKEAKKAKAQVLGKTKASQEKVPKKTEASQAQVPEKEMQTETELKTAPPARRSPWEGLHQERK